MADAVSQQFDANVRSTFSSSNPFIVQYPGQPEVIAFNLTAMMMLQQDSADPTTLAVYLGSWPSKLQQASRMCS